MHGIRNFNGEIDFSLSVNGACQNQAFDIYVGIGNFSRNRSKQTFFVFSGNFDCRRKRSGLFILPCYGNEPFRLQIQKVRAIGQMDDNPAPAADKADNLITRNRLAAFAKCTRVSSIPFTTIPPVWSLLSAVEGFVGVSCGSMF